MSRVVLHIGTHKTATTTIQDMFSHNAALLAEHGIIYPRLRPAAGHHGLVTDWNRTLPSVYAWSAGSLGTLQQIAAKYGSRDKTVFLSSEEFSRGTPQNRPDFTQIRQVLADFDEIAVVCTLREQWQFVQSIYLEVSKSRHPERPPQLLEAVLATNMVDGLWTDYNLLYDRLLEDFAPEEITFLDFDTARKAPGGVIGAMLAYLGTDLAAEALESVHGGLSNASPLPLPSWAANIIADPYVAPHWLLKATTGAFEAQFGPEVRSHIWTREEYSMLQDYARRCNDRLSDRRAPWQPDFAISSYPATAVESRSTHIFREDISAEYWTRCSRRLYVAGSKSG